MPVAHRHHRLQRDDHAFAQDGPPLRRSVVRHLRRLVHLAGDAVADVLAHGAQTPGPDVIGDRASRVTSIRRCAVGETSPTPNVTAVSPTKPLKVAPRSMLTMSPSRITRSSGMPCTSSSLIAMQN